MKLLIEYQYIQDTIVAFKVYKQMAEDAIKQCPDSLLTTPLNPNTNSVSVIMRHMSGNLISRFTNFLTEDGEKDWRNRDVEFEEKVVTREELVTLWDAAWDTLFSRLQMLCAEDLHKVVKIRGKDYPVILAIQIQLGHMGYHIGQIVQVARIHAGDNWNTITIPKGGSAEYNATHWGQA